MQVKRILNQHPECKVFISCLIQACIMTLILGVLIVCLAFVYPRTIPGRYHRRSVAVCRCRYDHRGWCHWMP